MKAIKIDAESRCISIIDVETLEDKRAVVGGLLAGCGYMANNDFLMVDDEGLLKNPKYFFRIAGYRQSFAGNGILVGTTEDGDEQDVQTTVKELAEMTDFLDIFEVRERAAACLW